MKLQKKHTYQQPSPTPPPDQTYLNTFDLYIESAKLEHKGYFYIQWRRGKKATQTLKHESDGKAAVLKENLTLNVTLVYRGGRAVEKNTVLTIYDGNQGEIDHVTLPIHKWLSEYTSMEIQINNGLIKARVRRRQLMQIVSPYANNARFSPYSNYQHSPSQNQNSELFEQEINLRMMMSQTKTNRTHQQIDTIKDETDKLRKQLQDTLYVNNKLKNDRSILMTRNLQLQTQLSWLKTSITQQLQSLQSHHAQKLELHQQIYQQQINNIITTFNANSQHNHRMLNRLLEESKVLDRENREMKEGRGVLEGKVRELEGVVEGFEGERERLEAVVRGLEGRVEEERMGYMVKIQQLEQNNKKYAQQLQQTQQNLQKSQTAHHQTLTQHNKNTQQTTHHLQSLQQQIQSLTHQLQQYKSELQFTEQTYRNEKQNNEQKEETYRAHIVRLEGLLRDMEESQERELGESQERSRELEGVARDNCQLKREIMRLRGQVENQLKEIQRLNKLLQDTKKTHQLQLQSLQSQLQSTTTKLHTLQTQQPPPSIDQKSRRLLHEKTQLIQNLSSELQSQKARTQQQQKQIEQALEQNQKLRDQLQFLRENAIDVEEYEGLQARVLELEARVGEEQEQEQEFPSFDKDMGMEINNFRKNKKQYQNISFQAKKQQQLLSPGSPTSPTLPPSISIPPQKLTQLEQQLQSSTATIQALQKQNEELKERVQRLEDLIAEMREKEEELIRKLEIAENTREVKIVNYCQSQEEENRRMEEEYVERMTMNNTYKNISNLSQHEYQQDNQLPNEPPHSPTPTFSQSTRLKKASSMQVDLNALNKRYSNNEGRDGREGSHKNNHMHGGYKGSRDGIEELSEENSRRRDSFGRDERDRVGSQVFGENGASVELKASNKKSYKNINSQNPDIIKSQQQKRPPTQPPAQGPTHTKKPSQPHPHHDTISQSPISSTPHHHKSNQLAENTSNRSRESFVSGTTRYKFHRISHKEKIKRLEQEVEDYRQMLQQHLVKEKELLREIDRANRKLEGLEAEMRVIEQDKNQLELKASLHFQLQKQKPRTQATPTQTDPTPTTTKSTQANIQIEDKQKTTLTHQLQTLKSHSQTLQSQIANIRRQHEYNLKIMQHKNEDLEKRCQEVTARYQEKCGELDRVRAEIGRFEEREKERGREREREKEREREVAGVIERGKIDRARLQAEIQRLQSDNKKYKQSIQQLQIKLKKSTQPDKLLHLQFQLQSTTKKLLDQTRTLHQLKLQKDTIQDQAKLLRKRQTETMKKSTELEYSVESLEKILEEHRRKEAKLRREIEEKEDQVGKLREQVKRAGEEIAGLKGIGTEQMYERKKFMDQITSLQNTNQRKQYDILHLKKQLQKLRYTLQQKQQHRNDHKSHLTKTIHTLQSQLSAKTRQLLQLEATLKNYSNKIQFLTAQNRRSSNQRSILYSDKLRVYVEEIAEIKRLLDENVGECEGLRGRVRDLEGELGDVRGVCGRLEERVGELGEVNRGLEGYVQGQVSLVESLQGSLQESQAQVSAMQQNQKLLKSQIQSLSKQNQSKKQQIDSLNKQNQQLLEQNNKNKIKISDLQVKLEIGRNYQQKIGQGQKQLKDLRKQLRDIQRQHDQYKSKYTYTTTDHDTQIRTLETTHKQSLAQALQAHQSELAQSLSSAKKSLQAQILQLLSETATLRTESQRKSQLISELEFQVSKLEILPLKVQELEAVCQEHFGEVNRLRKVEEVGREMREKVRGLEQQLTKYTRINNQLTSQLHTQKSTTKSLQQSQHQSAQTLQSLQLQLQKSHQENTALHEQQTLLKTELERLLSLIKSLQEEKSQILQKSEQNRKEHNAKIYKLETKLEEMSSTVSEHGQVLAQHYERNLEDIKGEVERLYIQLQDKQRTINDTNQIIHKLEYQLQHTKKQHQQTKTSQSSELELFQLEYNKLKAKSHQAEKQYKTTIENLELELEQMSREMTSIKLKSMNMVGSREGLREEGGLARLEEKLRQKDRKLEEFMQNMFVLEETIVKFKKKQLIYNQMAQKHQKLQKQHQQLQTQHRKLAQHPPTPPQPTPQHPPPKPTQLLTLKSHHESLKLTLQQKQLELQSLRLELQTTKQLYSDLHRELEKRKVGMRERVDEEIRLGEELRVREGRIGELEELVGELEGKGRRLGEELGRKVGVIQGLEDRIAYYEKQQYKQKQSKPQPSQHYKSQITRLSTQNQTLTKTNKKLQQQLSNLQQQITETKTKLSLNQSSMDTLNLTLEQVSGRCRQLEITVRKFQDLNEACFSLFHFSLDEAVFGGAWTRMLEGRDLEIGGLGEEVEELKFLNQRKQMDLDQLKKQVYELQLKLDDAEFAETQVEELRNICDKLQQEKKQAVLREEMLKVQLESLVSSGSNAAKERIEKGKIEELLRRTNVSNVSVRYL